MEVLYYVLYSSLSDKESQKELEDLISVFSHLNCVEIISLDGKGDIGGILRWFDPNAKILLFGDDNTIGKFIDAISGISVYNELIYYPVGKKRDFLIKVTGSDCDTVVDISDYISEKRLCQSCGDSTLQGDKKSAVGGGT